MANPTSNEMVNTTRLSVAKEKLIIPVIVSMVEVSDPDDYPIAYVTITRCFSGLLFNFDIDMTSLKYSNITACSNNFSVGMSISL